MRRGKLGSVFQQVIDHLGDQIPVALHHDGILRDIGLHVQAPVIDLLLHAEQGDAHHLADVEVLLLHLLGLDLGDIQHTAHQPAQAAALVGNNLQVVLLPLRRDGAVQNTVGITGDGGHGGLQLVGHVGDEVPALPLRLRQRIRHGVEGLGQLTDLVAAVQLRDAHVEVTGGIGAGGLHHVGDGLDLPHGGDGAGQKGDQQNDGGGHQEQADKGAPHLHDLRLVHHRQHDAQQLAVLAHDGDGHGELLGGVGVVDVAAALIQGLFRQDVIHDLLGDHDAAAHQIVVGGQQYIALGRADEEVHIRHP